MSQDNDPNKADSGAPGEARDARSGEKPTRELLTLLELAAKYPEIGPPLAQLAFKLGQREIAERVVRLGREGDGPGLEYYFVTAQAARRDGRWSDALDAAAAALNAFVDAPDDALAPDDDSRLLHLLRFGFSTLLFEIKDANANPSFVEVLAAKLPALESRMGEDAFYRTLLAQTLWFSDREQSEKEWDRAANLGESEFSWNARGTWYKEAERDSDKAEQAYREGLKKTPKSALLLHNVAQVLIDRAEARAKENPGDARRLLGEADELLRAALRENPPRGRRHIYASRDRLHDLRRSLPRPPRRERPEGDGAGRSRGSRRGPRTDKREQRSDDSSQRRSDDSSQRRSDDRSQRRSDDRGQRRSDDRSERRGRPADKSKRKDGGRRGDRSRSGPRSKPDSKSGSQSRSKRNDQPTSDGKFNLGDMLLAKLKEQENKD